MKRVIKVKRKKSIAVLFAMLLQTKCDKNICKYAGVKFICSVDCHQQVILLVENEVSKLGALHTIEALFEIKKKYGVGRCSICERALKKGHHLL